VDANIIKTMRDMHVRLMYATAEKDIIRFETPPTPSDKRE
jgi:hypothetical protein